MHRLALLLPIALLACTRAAPPINDRGPRWQAIQVARIGGDSGAHSFASVRSLLFSATGELFVVDDRDQEVKVFDTTGTFVRQLGRAGAGPAEYKWPYSLAWLHDTLALLDPGNARIGLFGPDGRWAGSFPVQPISGGSDVRLYRTGPAEFWAFGFKVFEGKAQSVFVRYTGAGAQDTLPYFRSEAPSYTVTCEVPRGIRFFRSPFAPTFLQLPTSSRIRLLARTDRYRVQRLGEADDTSRYVSRDEPLAAISDSEWEAGLAEWREFRSTASSPKCDGDDLARPAGKPILGAIFYDLEERLWVEVHATSGVRYDLWDPTGYPAGQVMGLPASNEIDPTFFGDLIALALPDEGEGPGIGIYRLTRMP